VVVDRLDVGISQGPRHLFGCHLVDDIQLYGQPIIGGKGLEDPGEQGLALHQLRGIRRAIRGVGWRGRELSRHPAAPVGGGGSIGRGQFFEEVTERESRAIAGPQ